jgi:hypothetical protein
MKKLMLFLMLVCSTSFAAEDPAVTVGAIYAAGILNGVYSVAGESATVRIYYDTQDLYVSINGRAMAEPKVEKISATDNTVVFSHMLQNGRAVNSFERMSDGILWTLEDGGRIGLIPVRALNRDDTMDLMCKTKHGADLVTFKKAALASTGSVCRND